MNEKDLQEIAEWANSMNHGITQKIVAEVRRLREEYKSLKESHFVYFAENITLKEERDYLNQAIEALKEENQHYKQALEEIVNQHDKPHSDRWTLAEIATKALKGEEGMKIKTKKCEGCYQEKETKLTRTEYDKLWLCEQCRKLNPND